MKSVNKIFGSRLLKIIQRTKLSQTVKETFSNTQGFC